MKKHWTIAVLMCFLLLTGCCDPVPTPPVTADPPAVEVPSVPDTPVTPDDPDVPTVPEKLKKSAILEAGQPMDDTGVLRQIPNETVQTGLLRELLLTEQAILLYGSGMGSEGGPAFCLTLLSRETGMVLHTVSIPGLGLPEVQAVEGGFAVCDWETGRILRLDDTLTVQQEFDAKANNCGVYVNTGFTRAFVLEKSGGIRVVDMATGGETRLLTNAMRLLAAGNCGTAVAVTYTDGATQMQCYAVLDLETEEVSGASFEGSFSGLTRSGEMWLARVMGESNTYWLGRSGRPNAFTPAAQNSMVDLLPDGRLLSITYGPEGADLQLYDTDGSFRSACRLPAGTGLLYDPQWSKTDGGYWFTIVDPTGRDILLFWDLSVPTAGQDLVLTSAYRETQQGSAVSPALYDRAAKLREKGLTVKIAELAQTEFTDYTAAPELDEAYIAAALDTVEQVAAAYPDGFFAQLCHGTVREIVLHLTGSIQKREASSGFTSFAGFTETREGISLVTVDITTPGSFAQTLHHEIFHLIDNRLTFDAGLRPEAFYSEEGWSALNPEGFAYANSYHDLDTEFYSAPVEAWFTKLYSRTYAREDRATVFEYAVVGTDWIFGTHQRIRKLEYLCKAIRDCFDTAGWPAATTWEACCLRAGGSIS